MTAIEIKQIKDSTQIRIQQILDEAHNIAKANGFKIKADTSESIGFAEPNRPLIHINLVF